MNPRRLLSAVFLAIVPAIAGCTSDTDVITPRFAAIESCPADRVIVSRATSLELAVPEQVLPRPPPAWSEPVPPPEVGNDPERLAIWTKQRRDSAYRAWTRAKEASNPDTNPFVLKLRQVRLYDTVGCSGRRLFACRDRAPRWGETPRGAGITVRECAEIPYSAEASSESQPEAIARFLGSDAPPYPVVVR